MSITFGFPSKYLKKQTKKLGKKNPYSKTLRIRSKYRRGRPGQYSGDDAYSYKTVKNPYYISPDELVKRAQQQAQKPTPAPAPAPPPPPPPPPPPYTPTPAPTPPPQTTFDTSAYDQAISDLNMRIADLTQGFQSQVSSLTSTLESERAASAKQMQELQGSFAQSLASQREQPRIEGVRFADRGAGGQTQAQLQRKGVRGAFGRSGDRLMKIQSLNV